MKSYIYSDLACENYEYGNTEYEDISTKIKRIKVNVNEPNEKNKMISKEYVTFYTPKLWNLEDEDFFVLRDSVADVIKWQLNRNYSDTVLDHNFSVLVVGMGNPHLTPDSLGAKTVKRITVTRNISFQHNRMCVSAVIPDVMGNTGIETADIIKAHCECVKPNAIIIIDSLASRSITRLASTVQICDSGIVPGSGIGRGRRMIDPEKLNIPVISVGIPTVINVPTMIAETLDKIGGFEIDSKVRELLDNSRDLYVTPKETDLLLNSASVLLSSALDSALIVDK